MYEIFEKLMQERGVTHYQIWKDTGVAQSSLSDWKYGKSKPGADKLAKLADYFGVSVDYLMGREQKEKPAAGSGELEPGDVYLSLAKDMKAEGIHPDDIRDMMEFLKKRNRNDKG